MIHRSIFILFVGTLILLLPGIALTYTVAGEGLFARAVNTASSIVMPFKEPLPGASPC